MRRSTIAVCALCAVALGAAGRAKDHTVVRADAPRAVPTAEAKAEIPKLVRDLDAFALEAYQVIREGEKGNVFYSPLSVSLALAMASAGAEGDTRAEMYEAMHVDLPRGKLHPAFNALDLAIVGDDGDDHFTLHIANGLWTQEGFTFRPAFLDVLARDYGAGLDLVDFKDDARREQARRAINDWVSDETNRKIKDLIPPGMLNRDTRLVLANAIYFMGKWVKPFDPDSPDKPFTQLDGSTVQIPMMSRQSRARYANGNGCQAAALDYRGDRIEMVVLLPAPDTFDAFDAAIDAGRLGTIIDNLEPVQLDLELPRFTYESTLDFIPILKAMGMEAAFDPGKADFSGITTEQRLFIAGIVHKAFVAVDEDGTEAAAATGITFGVTAMPEQPQPMHVDRPFLFVIRDRQTGAILFMGRVMDPR